MDRTLDWLSLALGYQPPLPVRWGVVGLWWALFALAGVSMFPADYAALQGVVADAGLGLTLPPARFILPAFTGFNLLFIVYVQMVARRRELRAAARGEPAPGTALTSEPTPRITPAQLWSFALVATLLFGYVLWRWVT
jgi:hypothetical protein